MLEYSPPIRREPDRFIANSLKEVLTPAPLTERNLEAFTRLRNMGRPKKVKTSNEPKATGSDSKSLQPSDSKTSSNTKAATDPNFPRLAYANGILNPVHSKPPGNLHDLQDQLDKSRDSQSPSESQFRTFARKVKKAPNEASIFPSIFTLLKDDDNDGYDRVINQAFSEFPKNVGLNDGLSAAQPDIVQGLCSEEFDPFPIREELGGAAVPTPECDPPTLPHLAGELKGPGKDMILAETQAAYDGACMVYGRNKARSFLNSPDSSEHAYVQTFTTDGTNLNTFAHYSHKSEGQLKYHQYPTSSSLIISSYEEFKKARRRLRNLQDVARETSEKLRDELKQNWSAKQKSINKEDDTHECGEEEELDETFVHIPRPDASSSAPPE